jgi:hypothetical protein
VSPVTLLQHKEAAAWSQFLSTRSDADLQAWRKALDVLHAELESRVRLLRTSARAAP